MRAAVALLLVLAPVLASAATLKESYDGLFRIGVALNQRQFEERDQRALKIVAAEFNSISPENALKWESVHPRPAEYRFDAADRYVAFGEKQGMQVIGHALVWHNQTPSWVFQDERGAPLTRDALLARMREHIHTVVGRYKGRIAGWDVVNEALDEDGTLRKSPWQRIIGDDYIEQAFAFAREADPSAELYYNDYSIEREAKRAGAVRLMQRLLARGVKITAIGLQGHDHLRYPSGAQQEATIRAFASLGLQVNITELDIDPLPRIADEVTAEVTLSAAATDALNPYRSGLPDAKQRELAEKYGELFAIFAKYRGTIGRVTFWGVTDGDSWLNDWPVRGRTSYPLLFDRAGARKPAYDEVLAVAKRLEAKP
ncbi:endo-1,4-beta-xylanase [Roseiterribacter gracilis]|uniref:Beta-xylanase n=1 Tax=Roseiterribacter gracilis TaxID=2812848 RepID=A0A8S8XEX2_9PROT|nr:beta-xylanase [Rhodospirillales bacterium TMPK1]